MFFHHEKSLFSGTPRPFFQHLQLRPHGDRLLTPGVAFWLFAARVLVLTMAGVEALAWGYLGYLFGDDWIRWFTAGLTGVTIFLVVWMIDISLLTLDRASEEHARRIFNESISKSTRGYRTAFAVTTRILVVVGSLTITAPYLSQLVFHKEIRQWIDTEATSIIEQSRSALEEEYDRLLIEKSREIEMKRDKLEAEVAGAGQSGRYGTGPVSEAIQNSIDNLELERAQLTDLMNSDISRFNGIAENWNSNRDTLAAQYDLVLPESSILSNREALAALRSRKEHQETELAIKAFLGFIFVGLLLLKLFEPRSTRYYLSEVLQQEYSRYLSGSFDELLPDSEKASVNPNAMTPQRLYDFLANVWSLRRTSEVREIETRARKAAVREDIATLEEMLERARPMVETARSEVEKDRRRCDQAMDSYQRLLSAMNLVQSHVTEYRAEQQALEANDTPLDPKGIAEYGTFVRSQLCEAKDKLRELQQLKTHDHRKLESIRRSLAEAESALRDRTRELRRIEEKVYEARSMVLSRHLRVSPTREENYEGTLAN